MTRRDDDTTARDAAFLGGGALAAYLLLRGFNGFGLGGGGGGRGGEAQGATDAPVPTSSPARPFCNVFVRQNRYELEGVPSDFGNAVAACRSAGGAYVRYDGSTRQGVLDSFLVALLEGGVQWFGGSASLHDHVSRARASLDRTRP